MKDDDYVDPATLVDKTPALYRRLHYKGVTRYTYLKSGERTVEEEQIVIVQAFFRDGKRLGLIPKYKLGYIKENGDMGLKLSLQPGAAPSHPAIRKSLPLVATFSVNDSAGRKIEGVMNEYANSTSGAVELWSTTPWTDELCWRYSGFWGHRVQRPFEDDSNPIKQILQADDPPDLFVDGWGHKTGREKGQAPNYIVRTMNYSKLDDEGKPVAVFVRSSELEVSKPEEQEEEFENFYD